MIKNSLTALLFLTLISMYSTSVFGLEMKLNFYPSFLDSSTVVIKKTETGHVINLTIGSIQDSAYLNQKAIDDITAFMKGYHFVNDPKVDPLIVHVSGKYAHKNTDKKIEFNRPTSGSEDHSLIALLYTIMYAQIEDPAAVVYLEKLEQQFDFGLGMKVLADDPLTYKLYGRISAKEANPFYAFLMSIPINQPVYIDMSNFSSMGRVFYPSIREIAEKNKELYWINCTDAAVKHLKNALNDWANIKK